MKRFFIIILCIFIFNTVYLHAGKLKDFEDKIVKENKKEQEAEKQVANENSEAGHININELAQILQALSPKKVEYLPYPYYQNFNSYYYLPVQTQTVNLDEIVSKKVNMNFSADYSKTDKEIISKNFNFKLRSIIPLGIEFNSYNFEEDLGNGSIDRLKFNSLRTFYTLIRTQKTTVDLGFGMKSIKGNTKTSKAEAGLETDLYLFRPVNISLKYYYTSFNSTALTDMNFNLGFIIKRLQIFIGYNILKMSSSRLAGPKAGLSIYW